MTSASPLSQSHPWLAFLVRPRNPNRRVAELTGRPDRAAKRPLHAEGLLLDPAVLDRGAANAESHRLFRFYQPQRAFLLGDFMDSGYQLTDAEYGSVIRRFQSIFVDYGLLPDFMRLYPVPGFDDLGGRDWGSGTWLSSPGAHSAAVDRRNGRPVVVQPSSKQLAVHRYMRSLGDLNYEVPGATLIKKSQKKPKQTVNDPCAEASLISLQWVR